MQNNLDPNKNYDYNNRDGPFPVKSIIEEGNNVDNIMNFFFYFNLFISICILILVILLIYFYRYYKNFLLYITWVFSIIFSYIYVYLVYNLVEDIDRIAKIYKNILNPLTDEIKETK